MIHQELSLVPELSVAENVFLGAEPARRGVVDRDAAGARGARRTRPAGPGRGSTAGARVADLPLAARQMTEIAKAVAARARVLIMDEPTAILAQEETDALFRVIAQLRDEGVAIVYISHRLDEIFRIAGRVTVLRDGRLVTSAPAARAHARRRRAADGGARVGGGVSARPRPAPGPKCCGWRG